MKINQIWLVIITLSCVNLIDAVGKNTKKAVTKPKTPVAKISSQTKASITATKQLGQAQGLLMGSPGVCGCAAPPGGCGCSGGTPPNPTAALAILNQITSATPTEYQQAQALIAQINQQQANKTNTTSVNNMQ